MLRICNLCNVAQKKTSSGNCNQSGCKGTLAKAWKCDTCNVVQTSTIFNNCAQRGCKGNLQKLRDEVAVGSAPPRSVVPESHRYMGTASQASRLVVETSESTSSAEPQDIRGKLMQMHMKGPPQRTAASAAAAPERVIDDAPKVLRSAIPPRGGNRHGVDHDFAIAVALMQSPEMRRIVVTNLLVDYEPSEGARQALELTESQPGIRDMVSSMTVVPRDAPAWDLMGMTALKARFAACQQCVGIVFHKLLQNSSFSSQISLIQVPGHHFVVFGDFTGSNWQSKTYIVDLWLQNLHRPACKSIEDLTKDSADWQLSVFKVDSQQAEWYRGNTWTHDLDHDPYA